MTPLRRTGGSSARTRSLGTVGTKRLVLGRVASRALTRARLDILAAAFLSDGRPGLIFEYGRLVGANDAARTLLRSTEAVDDFLNALRQSIESGPIGPGLVLRARSGVYVPVLISSLSHKGHPTRICFLIKQSEMTPACNGLSERELDVVRLLVKGLTNQEIADDLGISIETVRKHVSKALEKTGTKTRTALASFILGR